MKRGTNIVPGADVDTWDFFARNETPPLRPVSPWPRPPPRASTARTCKRPKPEVWRPTTAYGTLDGTLSRRPGILDDDSTRRDFEIVRPWTPFPEPDATTVEEALYLWTPPRRSSASSSAGARRAAEDGAGEARAGAR